MDENEKPTFIDLFCGCGGFSLGMEKAGFKCLAAIDFNEEAVATFRANFPRGPIVLKKDLSKFTPVQLAKKIGTNSVDVIVGGPPCQGFSGARQVDAANHGRRVRRDKRRYLFRAFLDYVVAFRPRVFVMENVLGIQSAAKGKFFTMVQAEARKLGYRVQAQVEESWKLGVPQSRRRQLFIGVRNDIPGYFPGELRRVHRLGDDFEPKLWDAIGDLPSLLAGTGDEVSDYDVNRRDFHIATRGEYTRKYLFEVLEIQHSRKLTAHRARPHNERDLRDFLLLNEGENSGEVEARGVKMEFSYNRTCFTDRYKRQHRERLCSTIVAHLSKDGLGFIHPTENRSLTPREAARVQSFPDWFKFPVARTHQFRVIGNAVPPLVAEAVGEELMSFIRGASHEVSEQMGRQITIPRSEEEAVLWVRPLLDLPPRALQSITKQDFMRAWASISFLYAGLHPDSALDHGDKICRKSPEDDEKIGRLEPRLQAPYYERSGWPVILAPIAREAWRRWRKNELTEDEFYCCEAQRAGMSFRTPDLARWIQNDEALSISELHPIKEENRWQDGTFMN